MSKDQRGNEIRLIMRNKRNNTIMLMKTPVSMPTPVVNRSPVLVEEK